MSPVSSAHSAHSTVRGSIDLFTMLLLTGPTHTGGGCGRLSTDAARDRSPPQLFQHRCTRKCTQATRVHVTLSLEHTSRCSSGGAGRNQRIIEAGPDYVAPCPMVSAGLGSGLGIGLGLGLANPNANANPNPIPIPNPNQHLAPWLVHLLVVDRPLACRPKGYSYRVTV